MEQKFSTDDIEKVVIPNSKNLTEASSNIKNMSPENSNEIMEQYMKNIKSNTKCSQPRFTNNFMSKTNIESIERQKLLQIVKLNELKFILMRLSILENLSIINDSDEK